MTEEECKARAQAAYERGAANGRHAGRLYATPHTLADALDWIASGDCADPIECAKAALEAEIPEDRPLQDVLDKLTTQDAQTIHEAIWASFERGVAKGRDYEAAGHE